MSRSKITQLFSFFFLVALKSSNSNRPEINGIQENCRTANQGEGMQILEGELLLQVCFADLHKNKIYILFNVTVIH